MSTLLLGLAWFAIANAGTSALSWCAGSLLLRSRLRALPEVLLAARLLPAAASLLFVTSMFLPSHWRFEPAGTDESFGAAIFALAIIGALLLLRSGARACAVARAGRRLRCGQCLPRSYSTLPAGGVYEVSNIPGISLAGVFRPRILMGASVRRYLLDDELEVAVAHELAHRSARDNLKRFALVCAPDLFGRSSVARELEDRWRAAAESLADARAVGGDNRRALHLASALIKVAKIAAGAPAIPMSPAWSNLNEPPLLEMRVRRLLSGTPPAAAGPASARAVCLAGLLGVILLASSVPAALMIHQATEALVRFLP